MEQLLTISGLFGSLAFIVCVWKLQLKLVRNIYAIDILQSLLFTVHLCFIGGIAGIVVNIMSGVRSALRLSISDTHIKPIIITSTLFTWIAGLYFYEDLYSLFPLIATSIISYGMLKEDREFYTNCVLVHYVFWMLYGVHIGSIYMCASIFVSAGSCIIGKIRHENLLGKILLFRTTIMKS